MPSSLLPQQLTEQHSSMHCCLGWLLFFFCSKLFPDCPVGKKGVSSVFILQLIPMVFFDVLSNASHGATRVTKSYLGGKWEGERIKGMLDPLCLCCGPLASLEERVALEKAGLKLVHEIAGPTLGVLGLFHQNTAKIAAWDKSALKQACLRYEQPGIESLERC